MTTHNGKISFVSVKASDTSDLYVHVIFRGDSFAGTVKSGPTYKVEDLHTAAAIGCKVDALLKYRYGPSYGIVASRIRDSVMKIGESIGDDFSVIRAALAAFSTRLSNKITIGDIIDNLGVDHSINVEYETVERLISSPANLEFSTSLVHEDAAPTVSAACGDVKMYFGYVTDIRTKIANKESINPIRIDSTGPFGRWDGDWSEVVGDYINRYSGNGKIAVYRNDAGHIWHSCIQP